MPTHLRPGVLGAAVVVEEDVLGLQVAVDDVLRHHRPDGASCNITERGMKVEIISNFFLHMLYLHLSMHRYHDRHSLLLSFYSWQS